MRKKIYCMMLVFLFSSVISMKAQMTIGSQDSPHSGAVLDLQSTSKGLLLPNVPLSNVNTFTVIPRPTATQKLTATGMVVYNTNENITGGNGNYGSYLTGISSGASTTAVKTYFTATNKTLYIDQSDASNSMHCGTTPGYCSGSGKRLPVLYELAQLQGNYNTYNLNPVIITVQIVSMVPKTGHGPLV